MKETNASCEPQPQAGMHSQSSSVNGADGLTRLCDQVLIDLAKAGDQHAYVALYNRHSPMTARVVQRMMRNPEDTEDILQEACIRAFVHLESFDGRAAFSTWLTRIAVNCALMTMRKRRCRPDASIQLHTADAARDHHFVDRAPGPEKEYAHRQASRQLERAISQLSPVLQRAVTLRYESGLRIKEVARTIGISVPAVKSRLSRATSELRVLMNERHA